MPELEWIEVAAGEAAVRTFSPPTPPVSVSGWTLRFVVLDDFGGTAKLTLTPTILNATTGTFSVTLSSAQTLTTLGAGTWAWEAWRTDDGGETRVAFGHLVITPSAGPPT
jgi:hypothetical protein